MGLLLTATASLYPAVVSAVLSIFACYQTPGVLRWLYQMDQQCFRKQHLVLTLVVGVPGLLLGVLFPPIMLFRTLYKRRHSLHEPKTTRVYLFLLHSYKPQFYWWEVARLLYIMGLVCIRTLSATLEDT